jgi:hypothetical protein
VLPLWPLLLLLLVDAARSAAQPAVAHAAPLATTSTRMFLPANATTATSNGTLCGASAAPLVSLAVSAGSSPLPFSTTRALLGSLAATGECALQRAVEAKSNFHPLFFALCRATRWRRGARLRAPEQ